MYASMTRLIGMLGFRSTGRPRRELQVEVGVVVSIIHERIQTRYRS